MMMRMMMRMMRRRRKGKDMKMNEIIDKSNTQSLFSLHGYPQYCPKDKQTNNKRTRRRQEGVVVTFMLNIEIMKNL